MKCLKFMKVYEIGKLILNICLFCDLETSSNKFKYFGLKEKANS